MARAGGMCLVNSRLQRGCNCKEGLVCVYACMPFYDRNKTARVCGCTMDHVVAETTLNLPVCMPNHFYEHYPYSMYGFFGTKCLHAHVRLVFLHVCVRVSLDLVCTCGSFDICMYLYLQPLHHKICVFRLCSDILR